MGLRWAAAEALETQKSFRKIIGHRELWIAESRLDEGQFASEKSLLPIDKDRAAA
jgi:hypothetical protein